MDENIKSIVDSRYKIAGIDELKKKLDSYPSFEEWKQGKNAFCFYGHNQYSRNVQISGLKGAFESLGIPFYIIYYGNEARFKELSHHKNIFILSNESLLSGIDPIIKKNNCKILLFWRYYDDTPNEILAPKIGETEKKVIDKYKRYIVFVVSELSYEGNKRFLRGYVQDFGIPVMTFPWGVDIKRHVPVECKPKKDVFYIGTYHEKAKRIDDYFEKVIRRHTHTIIGPDWQRSPFRWLSNSIMGIDEFNEKISELYSSHLVSLSIHHDFEVNGYSCNERVFNAIACGGFVVSDATARIRELFSEDEIVTANDPYEYFEKAASFIEHPEMRIPYMEKAIMKIYANHTYHHRVIDLLSVILTGTPQTPFCPVLNS